MMTSFPLFLLATGRRNPSPPFFRHLRRRTGLLSLSQRLLADVLSGKHQAARFRAPSGSLELIFAISALIARAPPRSPIVMKRCVTPPSLAEMNFRASDRRRTPLDNSSVRHAVPSLVSLLTSSAFLHDVLLTLAPLLQVWTRHFRPFLGSLRGEYSRAGEFCDFPSVRKLCPASPKASAPRPY